MKKLLWLIPVGVIATLFFTQKKITQLKNLVIELGNVKIGKISSGRIPFKFDFVITNPNNQDLSLQKLNGVIYSGPTALGNFNFNTPVVLKKDSVRTSIKGITANISLTTSLITLLTSLLASSTPKLTFKGYVQAEGLSEIPFNYTVNATQM